MGILVKHQNRFGQTKQHYWRYNGLVSNPNRQPDGSTSVPTIAVFRSYDSEEAFKSFEFMEERYIEFYPTSSNANMAEEAYAAFKKGLIPEELAKNYDNTVKNIEELNNRLGVIEKELSQAHEDYIDVKSSNDENDVNGRVVVRSAATYIKQLTEEATTFTHLLEDANIKLSALAAEKQKYEDWQQCLSDSEEV